jgi:membrane glycosyltransferase
MALWEKISGLNYFPNPRGLLPALPVFPSLPFISSWHWRWAVISLTFTLFMLFFPKVLSFIWASGRRQNASLYGGRWKLFLSVVIESLISTLLAPVKMLFHSKFVVLTLMGKKIKWDAQSRSDHGTSWYEAINAHAVSSIIALSIGLAVRLIYPAYFFWLIPVLLSLVLSPALSVWTSRKSLGLRFRKAGLLLTPEEVSPAEELEALTLILSRDQSAFITTNFNSLDGFTRAVVDPAAHDLHLSFLRGHRQLNSSVVKRRHALGKRALEFGPQALSAEEKIQLLKDPAELTILHQAVWKIADPQKAALWGIA